MLEKEEMLLTLDGDDVLPPDRGSGEQALVKAWDTHTHTHILKICTFGSIHSQILLHNYSPFPSAACSKSFY